MSKKIKKTFGASKIKKALTEKLMEQLRVIINDEKIIQYEHGTI
jgi:hypothetical protein